MNNYSHSIALLAFAFLSHLSTFGQSPSQPGVFYVSNYSGSGRHTDYDMARQAADAYAAQYAWSSGSVLILKAGQNFTCDAVPLPSLGNQSTTSIVGAGSGVSSITKSVECSPSAATLRHNDSPNGALSRGMYQGFTVDANHVDVSACEMYGMSLTTFLDVACGDAAANSDHELEFGNHDANNLGWMDNIYIYDLKTFDTLVPGAGAVLTPIWNGGVLTGAQVVSGGTSAYTGAYTRAQVFGPDVVTCAGVPVITPLLNANHHISGAVVNSAGNCASTVHLGIVVQDGTPVTYGMKFTNMADSHAWQLQAQGETTYGIAWLSGSANNSIYGEQPSSNELYGLYDNANGNKHISPVFTNPAGYAADVWGQNGTLASPTLTWTDGTYQTASGYLLGNDHRVYQDWVIQNSTCGSTSSTNFLPIVTQRGALSSSNGLPSGAKPQNIEACDGTDTVHWQALQ